MSAIYGGGPAFPTHSVGVNELNEGVLITTGGMTLRDYFAAAALQGLLATPNGPRMVKEAVSTAWNAADEMLKARGGVQ